jgi:hypothetical protein
LKEPIAPQNKERKAKGEGGEQPQRIFFFFFFSLSLAEEGKRGSAYPKLKLPRTWAMEKGGRT